MAIVCASYNGGPPDNAGAFIKSLREAAPGSLKGVRYTVFGCGNRDWASTYQAIPRQIDELLADKGAERIYARGEGDAKEDLDGHFQAWNEPLLPALAEKLGVKLEPDVGAAHEPLYQVQAVDKPPANLLIGGAGALPMRVLVNRELQNAATSGRSTRHIEVLLPDGVSYRAGDHLSIVPQNGAALVERAIRRFGFAPGAHVMLAAAEGQARGAAGRRGDRGPSPAVGLRRAAAPGHAQADPDHGAAHALSLHAAQARGASRRGAFPRGDPGQAHVGARSAGAAIRPASCPSLPSSKCCR